MTKFKTFFQKKQHILIVLIAITFIIVVPLIFILSDRNKPVEVAQAPSSQPTSSVETKPTVIVPDIVVEKPVSSETISSKPNEIKVEGNPTSKPVEKPKPQPKVEKPKPEVSSKETAPIKNDGIDPKIQKILDDAGMGGEMVHGTLPEYQGTTGDTKAGTDDGGYN